MSITPATMGIDRATNRFVGHPRAMSFPSVIATNGSLTLTWDNAGINGAGTVLESNTNLENLNGWIPIGGTVSSPYTFSIPSAGSVFYRTAP
jgi:hypothetical protein